MEKRIRMSQVDPAPVATQEPAPAGVPSDPSLPKSPLAPGVDPVASTLEHAQKAHMKMHGKPMHPKHVKALKGLLAESFGTSTEPRPTNNVGTAGDMIADMGGGMGMGGGVGIGNGGGMGGVGGVPRGDDPSSFQDDNHAFGSALPNGSKIASCLRTASFVDELLKRIQKKD